MDYKTIRTHLNFEILSKLFFELTEERYPTAEKIKQSASKLINPITKDPYEVTHLKIAVISIMRNMIREVSPEQLYRSMQHRDDLMAAIIQALEELEDDLDELYEKLDNEDEAEEKE